MTKDIIRFLQRERITDTKLINSLFVSAFVLRNNWRIQKCSFIKSYILPNNNPLLVRVLNILDRTGCSYSLEELTVVFEHVISPEDRVVTGAVYTPRAIRELIISQTFLGLQGNISDITVGDIACGCGSFLMDISLLLNRQNHHSFFQIFREQIFGIDLEEYSIERTKILLTLLAISEGEDNQFSFNLAVADTLTFDFHSFPRLNNGYFDVIVGNPPYVCSRNMSEEIKNNLKNWSVCKCGHPDLYIPFFQIALEHITPRGALGFITMNSFFKSLNGRALREYFRQNQFSFSIIDFKDRQIFESNSTYTCICIIKKEHSDSIRYGINSDQDLSLLPVFHEIKYSALNSIAGWNLQDNSNSNRIESIGTPLGSYCQSRHGIATLSNKTFIFKPIREDSNYYYLRKQEKEYPIEKNICKSIINSNKMTRTVDFQSTVEKVIFPYHTNEGKYKLLEEEEFVSLFPMAYQYLKDQAEELFKRDKGKGKDYDKWYQFGRTQSLDPIKYKLFFPKIACTPPACILSDDQNLLFYNGQAFISDSIETLIIVKKIIESKVFWEYVTKTSKPYSSGYYCLNGNYIKNFGVYPFNHQQIEFLLNEDSIESIDRFLCNLYTCS